MKNVTDTIIVWAPRILAILYILFLALFSLDVLDMDLGFWETAVGLFIHNIPSFVLLIVLIISWKHEIVGGVVFILAAAAFIAMQAADLAKHPSRADTFAPFLTMLTIAGPALVAGVLFLIARRRKRRTAATDSSRP
jgi:hypothetical protein